MSEQERAEGSYHDEEYGEVCEGIAALRRYLEDHQLAIWSENGEPYGWVNVSCESHRNKWGGTGHTYEGLLRRYP